MRLSVPALWLAVVCAARGAAAQDCAPVVVGQTSDGLPDAWRSELDQLVQSSSSPGQPWSCTGARVSLLMVSPEKGAVLRVQMPDARVVERLVAIPADLVPTGQALLAAPPPAPPATSRIDAPPPARPETRESPRREDTRPASTQNGEPRLVVDAGLAVRFSGPDAVQWGAVEVDATVPLSAWSVTLWGRGAMPFWVDRDEHLEELKMAEYATGLAVGRRLLADPFELRASLGAAVALVEMDGENDDGEVEGARADFRLGAKLSAVWSFARPWRGVLSLDGELVPSPFVDEKARSIDPAQPDLLPERPRFTTGLTFGIGRELP